MKLYGQLPLGAKKKMCEDLKMSQSHINNILKDEDGTYNATPLARRTVWNYVKENYPKLVKGDEVTVIHVINDNGERILAAVCERDEDRAGIVRTLNKELPMRRIEETRVLVGELTPQGSYAAGIRTDGRDSAGIYDKYKAHLLSDIDVTDSRAKSTLLVILKKLGCKTLEDAAKIPIEEIMKQRGATKETAFTLRRTFDEYGIEY